MSFTRCNFCIRPIWLLLVGAFVDTENKKVSFNVSVTKIYNNLELGCYGNNQPAVIRYWWASGTRSISGRSVNI